MNRLGWAAMVAVVLAGCSGARVAIRKGFDFSKIHRVAVITFNGPGGDAVADALAHELLAAGVDVVERQRIEALFQEQRYAREGALDEATIKKIGKILGVDAIFTGNVIQASPSQSYLIATPEDGKVIMGGATPIGSGIVMGGGSAGVPGTSVVTSAATATVSAKMIEVETGALLWSASDKDEGFDALATFSTISKTLVRSLSPMWIKE